MRARQLSVPELEQVLRAALAGAGDGFDLPALARGALRRARVLHRRRVLGARGPGRRAHRCAPPP